jgi:hypothetical protein
LRSLTKAMLLRFENRFGYFLLAGSLGASCGEAAERL